ncbi:flagellar basal body-associated FliL family protein [Marinimicrobium alkaliphilum]|uniref:flagellar basal body-associated FliL family protein n=1 Tax=Marinimicrobium alkaliphilum TaxID=2202654 RepID=UPI000DBAB1C0|nr:flagellar basal body-associated FliL family protein [Marinimicrobium alkaliphilum]
MNRVTLKGLAGAFLLVWLSAVWADEPLPSGANYIPLSPPFTVNYGGEGRLKYLQTEIALRAPTSAVADTIRHHQPLIRNSLILLLSRLSEEDVNTQAGRQRLRQQALDEVNALLAREEGEEIQANDLLFNTFTVQN